jgi:DNA-directed RNA polymerase subunit RPC12/RpoP
MRNSTPFTPPPNYHKVKSALTGISVYAPIPEVDRTSEVKTYNCPSCGASLAFDLSTSGLGCPYCGYQEAIQSQIVGRDAESSEFTVETVEKAQHGWGEMRKELHCDNCGAELSYPSGAIASSCPYCASNKVNVQTVVDDKLRPKFLITFKTTIESVRSIAGQWLGKGWFHPPTLTSGTALRNFSAIYLPYWAFEAHVSAKWRAEVGREEHYRVYNSASKSWETRTRIVWEWKQGMLHLPFEDYMVIGISKPYLNQQILKNIEPYSLSELVTYSPDFLVGLQAQAYDITLPNAWDHARLDMREKAKNACRASINSPHVRNFSMSADFADESWRYILLPVFLAAYKFEEKTFQVMVNGQTGKIAGQKPVAWWKIWLAIAACMLPGLLLTVIGLISSQFAEKGSSLICTGLIVLIPGFIASLAIFNKARKSEKGA